MKYHGAIVENLKQIKIPIVKIIEGTNKINDELPPPSPLLKEVNGI
jgi:hypothetical protein